MLYFAGTNLANVFYEQDPQLPIYQRIPSNKKWIWIYCTEDLARILLNPTLDLVSTKVPSSISNNVAFVVDTRKLEDIGDKFNYYG